ncbi:MAG: hypothetical protein QM734_05130 [Cyclobacteriaceae bacterium]
MNYWKKEWRLVEDRIESIPGYITKEKTLVVFTPAIPKDHKQYNYLKVL